MGLALKGAEIARQAGFTFTVEQVRFKQIKRNFLQADHVSGIARNSPGFLAIFFCQSKMQKKLQKLLKVQFLVRLILSFYYQAQDQEESGGRQNASGSGNSNNNSGTSNTIHVSFSGNENFGGQSGADPDRRRNRRNSRENSNYLPISELTNFNTIWVLGGTYRKIAIDINGIENRGEFEIQHFFPQWILNQLQSNPDWNHQRLYNLLRRQFCILMLRRDHQ